MDAGSSTAVAVIVISLAVVGAFLLTFFWGRPGCVPHWFLAGKARCCRKCRGKNGRPGAKGFTHTKICEGVILGSLPRGDEDLAVLREEYGVTGIVTLNEKWELLISPQDMLKSDFKSCWLPTPDYSAVRLKDELKGVRFMREVIGAIDGQGKHGCAYVHCNGGKGRSTAVVLCYLVADKGMSPYEAFHHVRKRRKIAKLLACRGSRPQFGGVKSFEKSIHTIENGDRRKFGRAARVAPAPMDGDEGADSNAREEAQEAHWGENRLERVQAEKDAADAQAQLERSRMAGLAAPPAATEDNTTGSSGSRGKIFD